MSTLPVAPPPQGYKQMTDTDTDGPASPHPRIQIFTDADISIHGCGPWGKAPATDSLCNGCLSKNCPNRCMQLQISITPCWAKARPHTDILALDFMFFANGPKCKPHYMASHPGFGSTRNQPCAQQLAHIAFDAMTC